MNAVFERTTETCVAAGYYQVLLPPNYFESSQTGPMTSVLPSASSHINGSGSQIVARLHICTAEIAFMAHGIARERCGLERVPSSSCHAWKIRPENKHATIAPQRFPFTFFGCRLIHVKSRTLFEESRTLVCLLVARKRDLREWPIVDQPSSTGTRADIKMATWQKSVVRSGLWVTRRVFLKIRFGLGRVC